MAPPLFLHGCLFVSLFVIGHCQAAKVTCPVVTVHTEPCEPCEGDSGAVASATCGVEDARLPANRAMTTGRLSYHANLLRDSVRTSVFRTAIFENAEALRGKVAVDVGAGVGVLSFFAAQAGVREVHAVEPTETALIAEKIAASPTNAPWGAKVAVHHGFIEDLKLAPGSADAIISDCFGSLFFNDLPVLSAFLHARDTLLKPGGLMFPEEATLFLAPFSNPSNHRFRSETPTAFWAQGPGGSLSYGVDWTAAVPEARRQSLAMPVLTIAKPEEWVSKPNKFPADLRNLLPQNLDGIKMPLDFEAVETVPVSGLVGWFDLDFPKGSKLSTAPWAEKTHWKQVHMLLKEPLPVETGQKLKGEFRISAQAGTHFHFHFKLCVGDSELCSESESIDLSDSYEPGESESAPMPTQQRVVATEPAAAPEAAAAKWKLPDWINSRHGWRSGRYNKLI